MRQTGSIACAGNWIVDIVNSIEHWPNEGNLSHVYDVNIGVGGGAANVSSNLRYLDLSLQLFALGCVGADGHGELIRQHCQAQDIEDALLYTLAGERTATTQVMSVSGKSRTFFYDAAANDKFDINHVDFARLTNEGVTTFYLGYPMLLGALDKARPQEERHGVQLLRNARNANLMTCVDLVSSAALDYQQIVQELLPHIDVLFLNEVELELASGIPCRLSDGSLNKKQAEKAALALLKNGVNKGVVVHCPVTAGWISSTSTSEWLDSVPLSKELVKSPVGAGDAFCAGVTYALHSGWSSIRALELGHLAARATLMNETAAEPIPSVTVLMMQSSNSVYNRA